MAASMGRITAFSDFLGANGSAAVLGPDISAFGVGTETYAATVDEPGGILALGTGANDDDNAVLIAGPYKAADGDLFMEARFKYSNVDCAVYVGFAETVNTTTPVMPAEFATATMTYNGTGGMIGFNYDADGTTDDYRAVMGDGGAAAGGSGQGTRALATLTADRWVIARVIVHSDGAGECWLGELGHVDGDGKPSLRLIKRFTAGLTPTDLLFAILMIENRSANARTLEVDYFLAEGGRDWITT